MKFGVVNKSTILNRFVLHTLQRNITHLDVITRKTNIKLGTLKGGNWKRAGGEAIMGKTPIVSGSFTRELKDFFPVPILWFFCGNLTHENLFKTTFHFVNCIKTCQREQVNKFWLFFLFSPTSLKHDFYRLPSGFTRLIMKIKYVCHGLVSLHVNLHDNRTKWTLNSNIKFAGRVGKGKRAQIFTTFLGSFSFFPPTSLKHEFYGLTSGFTRLIMKIKYVCHGLISLHVSFHDNRTEWTVTSNIKICRWGGVRKKSPFLSCKMPCEHFLNSFILKF